MTATSTKPHAEAPQVSEAPLTLLQRLNAVMRDVDYVQKDKKIDVGKGYMVVTHDAVTAKVRPALVKHGVFYYPCAMTHNQNGNRTEMSITVRFVNVDDGDDYIDVPCLGYGIDQGDKGPGKAASYAIKYALLKALGLETGEDADNEVTVHEKPEPSGEKVAAGPRGGRDKTPPADNEIKLYGYPGPDGPETVRYPRNVGGLKKWVSDMEFAFAHNMALWDSNSNMVEIVMVGINNFGLEDLKDKMQEMEARITVERVAS